MTHDTAMQGLRVGVTGARKAAQLAEALARRGALPVVGPLVTTDLPVDDGVLLAATDDLLAGPPPAWLAASTGVGMRLWADVALRHDRLDALRNRLAGARRIARGAKAVGGLAALDLDAEHVTSSETDAEVVAWLVEHAAAGAVVAAQLHGTDPGLGHGSEFDALVDRGMEVVAVQPYVAGRPPQDEARARDLVRAVADRALDVVTFTSPGAGRNLFLLAEEVGVADQVDEALRSGAVALAVVGPVTAAVFTERDLPIAVAPTRHRQGELVRTLGRWAAERG